MSTLPPDHVAGIAEQWRRERPELDLDPLLIIGRIEWIQARADAALRPLFADAVDHVEDNALLPRLIEMQAMPRRDVEQILMGERAVLRRMHVVAGDE